MAGKLLTCLDLIGCGLALVVIWSGRISAVHIPYTTLHGFSFSDTV